MSFDYLLFDLDGTLTNPALGITNSIMYALRKNNIEPPSREELYCCIGPPLIDAFMELWGFSREGAEKALSDYREYFSTKGIFENEVYSGTLELLKRLYDSGKKIYLATSKPEIYARQILQHFNLAQYFTFIAGNSLSEDRPTKADVISYLFKECPEIQKERAVMIGDRKYDILGAKETGLSSVGVLFGFGSEAELCSAGADHICDSPSSLCRLILGEDL